MKPAPFEYVRPGSIAEACEILASDDDARVIAGGQTLVPMLAMRLARPAKLVDIMRMPELSGIREESGSVVIGATTRQAVTLANPVIHAAVPALAAVLPWVGHIPTRNRGTIGGSIANADPSAEIPLAAITLGAELMFETTDGPTSMPIEDFIFGPMLTAINPGELLSAVRFPVWAHKNIGVGFFEVSARSSDFAFAAALAQVALDDDGRCVEATLGVGGVGDTALRFDVSSLVGSSLDDAAIAEVVNAVTGDLEASSDLHASASYRRRVAIDLSKRALQQARANASAKSLKGAA